MEMQNTPLAKEIIKQIKKDILNFEWCTWVH